VPASRQVRFSTTSDAAAASSASDPLPPGQHRPPANALVATSVPHSAASEDRTLQSTILCYEYSWPHERITIIWTYYLHMCMSCALFIGNSLCG
jgi:hypothetical protein